MLPFLEKSPVYGLNNPVFSKISVNESVKSVTLQSVYTVFDTWSTHVQIGPLAVPPGQS